MKIKGLDIVVKLKDIDKEEKSLRDKAEEGRVHVRYTRAKDKCGNIDNDFNCKPYFYKNEAIKYFLGIYTDPAGNEWVLVDVDEMREHWEKYANLYDKGGEKKIMSLSYDNARTYEASDEKKKELQYLIAMAEKCHDINGPEQLRERLKQDENIRQCSDKGWLIIDRLAKPKFGGGATNGTSNGGGTGSGESSAPAESDEKTPPAKAEGEHRHVTLSQIKRDPGLRRRKIADARRNNPQNMLVCDICGVTEDELRDRYPSGFHSEMAYEVHHIDPLSERRGESAETELDEVAVLCANCHCMVHIDKDHVKENFEVLQKHFDKQRGKK